MSRLLARLLVAAAAEPAVAATVTATAESEAPAEIAVAVAAGLEMLAAEPAVKAVKAMDRPRANL